MWPQANFNLVSVHPESVSLVTQVDIWGGRLYTAAPKVCGISAERGMSGRGARAGTGKVGAICLSARRRVDVPQPPSAGFLEIPWRGWYTHLPHRVLQSFFFDRPRLTLVAGVES